MIGKMVCVEGIEGAGKSSAIDLIKTVLMEKGIATPLCTREPGGTAIAERLRELIKHGADGEVPTIISETLMLYAARHQLVETVIKPALAQGQYVIADRHNLSTYAYQGAGRGVSLTFIDLLTEFCLEGFKPGLTLYLDLPPELGLERITSRNATDRIENEGVTFFNAVRSAYLNKAREDNSITVIDASQSMDMVHKDIRQVLNEWLAA